MFAWRFFVRLVMAVLVIAVLVGGGFALYRAGMAAGAAQGYLAGQAAASSPKADGAAPTTPVLPYYPGWGYGIGFPFFAPFHPFLGFFGLFFLIALFLFPLLAIGRFLAFRGFMHRAAMSGQGGPGAKEGSWMHPEPWGPESPKTEGEKKPDSPETK